MTDDKNKSQTISNFTTNMEKINWSQPSDFDGFGIKDFGIESVKNRLDKLEKSVNLFNDFLVHKGIAIENEFRDFVVSREILDKLNEITEKKEKTINMNVNVKMPFPAQYVHIDFQLDNEEDGKKGL